LQVNNFHLKLFLFWFIWVNSRTFIASSILSFLSLVIVYISKGFTPLDEDVFIALSDIAFFTFPFFLSLSFIISLLLVFKAVFFTDINKKRLHLYDCQDEPILKPLLSDITKIWRKWLFVTIWTVLIFMVIFLGLYKLVLGSFPPVSWLNGMNLYILVLVLGGSVFSLGLQRCTKIRIKDV